MDFDELTPGGMLSPDAFAVLDGDTGTVNNVRERDYQQRPDYTDVDGSGFGYLFGDDDAVDRDAGVAADGGEVTEPGYEDQEMWQVSHRPPEWSGMNNPSL